jgi:hypothetical protein
MIDKFTKFHIYFFLDSGKGILRSSELTNSDQLLIQLKFKLRSDSVKQYLALSFKPHGKGEGAMSVY